MNTCWFHQAAAGQAMSRHVSANDEKHVKAKQITAEKLSALIKSALITEFIKVTPQVLAPILSDGKDYRKHVFNGSSSVCL